MNCCSLALYLLVCTDLTRSKVHYISPSVDGPCPQTAPSCLTLSKFATHSPQNFTDVSLLFLPGYHTLDQELLLADGHNLTISKYSNHEDAVLIECTSRLGRFDISETISVSIKGLQFIGCGGNRVAQVTWLIIANSTFQNGVYDTLNESPFSVALRPVLVLNKVDTVNLVRSRFF